MAAPITKLRIGLKPDTPEEHTRLLINVNTEEAQTSLQIATDLRVRANPATAKIYYYNFDGSELLYTETIEPGGSGSWDGEPGRASTAQYEFIFNGWSTEPDQVDPTADATAGVYSERQVYAAYKRRDIGGFVTFSSEKNFRVAINRAAWNGNFFYSTDGVSWQTPVVQTNYNSQLQKNGRYEIYFRGIGNTKLSDGATTAHIMGVNWGGSTDTADVFIDGDIRTLLDFETALRNEDPEMADYAFRYLLPAGAKIRPRLSLPSKNLAPYCYAFMFYDSGVELPPELPAITLAPGCYQNMFSKCYSLTAPPELPATTLAKSCYEGMFSGCSGLQKPPALPAMTLTESCYRRMFANCDSLTEPPELPATTLAKNCYFSMLGDCVALEEPPVLPAQSTAEGCYQNMFSGCTSLREPPQIDVTYLAKLACASMFNNCSALRYPPSIPASVGQSSCASMFAGCVNLESLPALRAVSLQYNSYFKMFSGCSKIKVSDAATGEYSIPFRIPESGTGTGDLTALAKMFEGTGGTFTGTPVINTTYYLAPPASM